MDLKKEWQMLAFWLRISDAEFVNENFRNYICAENRMKIKQKMSSELANVIQECMALILYSEYHYIVDWL